MVVGIEYASHLSIVQRAIDFPTNNFVKLLCCWTSYHTSNLTVQALLLMASEQNTIGAISRLVYLCQDLRRLGSSEAGVEQLQKLCCQPIKTLREKNNDKQRQHRGHHAVLCCAMVCHAVLCCDTSQRSVWTQSRWHFPPPLSVPLAEPFLGFWWTDAIYQLLRLIRVQCTFREIKQIHCNCTYSSNLPSKVVMSAVATQSDKFLPKICIPAQEVDNNILLLRFQAVMRCAQFAFFDTVVTRHGSSVRYEWAIILFAKQPNHEPPNSNLAQHPRGAL